ncbi:Biofilm regulator 1 [Hyphodiscus hymeniophilus]|uniref:Biofilm regulator 1 n=1 Tax=Hyphodiscus hymeniophilus TaxID=353542 RepID=A0A9P6VSD0_9HELO|nr:Biofilm regulator 1 [Hyphodiscus hymeniophilus]
MCFRGLLSLINREEVDRITTTRPFTSTMAATSLVSPSSMSLFQNGTPPPYSESRRTSDNKTEPPPPIQTAPPSRQSLPSIHEALSSSGPKPNPYASPVSASLQASHQLPYSQQQAPSIPRTYSAEHTSYQPPLAPTRHRRPSPPQPVQPHPHPFTRTDSIPTTFPESRHGSLTTLQTAPGPPPNPYAAPRYELSRYEQDTRGPERTNGYTHHPPPPQHPSHQYGPPPSHIPSTGPPGAAYNQPRYQERDGREPVENWKLREGYKAEPPEFSHGLKRHLDVWDFENNLAQINTSSRVLMEWSHHYNAIAQEQQRGLNVIPDRMPTLDNCKEMVEHGDMIMFSIARMKEMIAQQEIHMMDQRMREQGGKGVEYDDDMTMYGDNMDKHGFGGSEGKKQRRGVRMKHSLHGIQDSDIKQRAAPPGRCHSCNRAETPEWRRGPDGARTLCNACGLHYAKLTRKQTMKQSQGSNGSSLRPKSMNDPLPRPI